MFRVDLYRPVSFRVDLYRGEISTGGRLEAVKATTATATATATVVLAPCHAVEICR